MFIMAITQTLLLAKAGARLTQRLRYDCINVEIIFQKLIDSHDESNGKYHCYFIAD